MEKEKICGIYKITSPTDRVYIGQSKDIVYERFKRYKKLRCKGQPILYRSLLKYGVENHTFEIIEECEVEDLNCRERYWQDFYDVLNGGLNCELSECGGERRAISEETVQRKKDASNKIQIGVYTLKGDLIKIYESVKEASRQLNIPDADIHRACKLKGQRNGFLFSKKLENKIEPYERKYGWREQSYKVTFINEEVLIFKSRTELLKNLKINPTTLYKHLNKDTMI